MCYLFVDTEFTDFKYQELMSIGIVSEDGQHEFYREVGDHIADYRSDFVKQVVVPLMDLSTAKSWDHVALDLKDWLDGLPGTDVTFIVDYSGDWHLLEPMLKRHRSSKRVFVKMLQPAFFHMLTERGCNPQTNIERANKALNTMMNETKDYYQRDPRQHHALVDARANRHGWVTGYEVMK